MSQIEKQLSILPLEKQQIKELTNEIKKYEEQNDLLYDIYFILKENPDNIDNVLNDLKNKHFNWHMFLYQDLKKEKEDEDKIIENPPEIREGEIECSKCGSKKTLTLESQIQRADEGYTYFIHCLVCKFVKKTKNF